MFVLWSPDHNVVSSRARQKLNKKKLNFPRLTRSAFKKSLTFLSSRGQLEKKPQLSSALEVRLKKKLNFPQLSSKKLNFPQLSSTAQIDQKPEFRKLHVLAQKT